MDRRARPQKTAEAKAAHGFDAIEIQAHWDLQVKAAAVQKNPRHDVIFQPATQPVKGQVVPLFEAPSQIAEEAQCGFRFEPVLEKLVEVEEAIGVLP